MKNEAIMKKLNNIFTILVIILIVAVLNTILISTSKEVGLKKNNNPQSEEVEGYDLSAFKEVSGINLAAETEGKTSVVYVGRASCSWCVKFAPILTKATEEYDLDTLYIDIAKIIDFNPGGGIIDQESYDALMNLKAVKNLEGYMKEEFGATPMLLVVRNGKIVAAQTGYTETDGLNSFLEKHGFKK